MIDIHCHLLPGIDDGAPDMVTSLALLKKAEQAGVTDMILTPHYIKGSAYSADNARKWQIFEELTEAARREGIKTRLYLGNEIYVDTELPEMLGTYAGNADFLAQGADAEASMGASKNVGKYEIATLNSEKYVLIELPVRTEDRTLKETVFEIVRRGFVPVIAHPERYVYVQQNPRYVEALIEMGCVMQGDYLALLGKYGKKAEKTLKTLLLKGEIFCLASDIHKFSDEYRLEEVEKKLARILKPQQRVRQQLQQQAQPQIAERIWQLLVENPQRILRGE